MDERLRNLQRLAYLNADDGESLWKYIRELERSAGFAPPEPETAPVIVPGDYEVSFNITFPGAHTLHAESAEDAMNKVENFFEDGLDLDWQTGMKHAVVSADWADLVRADRKKRKR